MPPRSAASCAAGAEDRRRSHSPSARPSATRWWPGLRPSLERVRHLKAAERPDLAAAFAAVGDEAMGVRLVLASSPETRRVFEELVPTLPRELGGGPITEFTRGVRWVAAGLDGPRPSFRLVLAAPNAEAARALLRRGPALAAFLEKSPFGRDVPRLVSQLKAEVHADRLGLSADAEVAASLMDAVLQPVRDSAAQSQCTNNEKHIALAIHNYISSTRPKAMFPPAYTTSKDGKPLLSWRVLILPYLEQEALYKQFHLDEPWDSPHNRTLIARMPTVYRCPMEAPDAAPRRENALSRAAGRGDRLPRSRADQPQGHQGWHVEHDHPRRCRRRPGGDLDKARRLGCLGR